MTPIIIDSEVASMAKSCVLCWLATSNSDLQPNVSPKEVFAAVNDRVIIANIKSPQSTRNLKANPQVCVAFVDVFLQKGFQVHGTARLLNREDSKFEEYHKTLAEIAGPEFPFATIIEVTPKNVKPIIAPRYVLFPDTTEEEQIESAMKGYGVKKR